MKKSTLLKLLVLLLFTFVNYKCEKVTLPDYKTVTIKQGTHHYSNFGITTDNSVSAKVRFHEDCYFPVMAQGCEGDLNKLIGLGQLIWTHGTHNNSGRICWRPDRQKRGYIEFWYYVYQDGISPQENTDQKGYITSIDVSKWHSVFIRDFGNGYNFYVNEVQKIIYTSPHKYKIREICGIYFGGNCFAPQNMSIDIKIK